MLKVHFKPSFLKQVKKLEKGLILEVLEKVETFKERKNHPSLGVHKLHGSLSGKWSFSVNYKFRIVFSYEAKNEAVLLSIGDHKIYN